MEEKVLISMISISIHLNTFQETLNFQNISMKLSNPALTQLTSIQLNATWVEVRHVSHLQVIQLI